MKIAADTSVLVRPLRAMTSDKANWLKRNWQRRMRLLALPALCELVWLLSQAYKVRTADIAEAIRRLVNGANVLVNRPAVEAGLAMLDAGGDFAEGVICYEGSWLGAEAFVSFDKEVTKLLAAQGGSVRLLS
jgi:predicted nucleic-acid-binding protein